MSAFICSARHIRAIAVYATETTESRYLRVDPRSLACFMTEDPVINRLNELSENVSENRGVIAEYYADIMYKENIKSVLYRYPSVSLETAPGPHDKPEVIRIDKSAYDALYRYYGAVDILKLCNSLKYQSCETEDWFLSSSWRLIHTIQQAAIMDLDGYDSAPWEI